jgi:integrase
MKKKYPESDPDFYMKVRGACQNDFERGLVIILQHTGMHISCLMSLEPSQLDAKGDIYWNRVRTDRQMRARVPKGDLSLVEKWIKTWGSSKRSKRWARYVLKRIGKDAGFPDLSPMSFRMQKSATLLDENMQPHEVCHRLGCSLNVLMDSYAQLKDDRRADQEGDQE